MADKQELAPAYLIYGTDAPKVRLAVARFKKRVINESGSDLSLTVLDARTCSGAEVVQLLQTGSFILGRRGVVVTAADEWTVKQRDLVAAYLADPFPDTTVALVGESFSRKEALAKTVARVGSILHYDLPKKREYAAWVQEQARGMNLKLGVAEARHLLSVVGEDPLKLENELRKLAAYMGGGEAGEIHIDDIDAVVTPGLEAQIWDLTDAVGRRDAAQAFRKLEELLALGGTPRRAGGASSDPARSIFAALARHVELLRRACALSNDVGMEQAGKDLGVHPFRAKKLLEQRTTFGARSIDRATVVLAEADAALVGASSLEPGLVLERTLARLLG